MATSGCNVTLIPQQVSVGLQWSLPTPLKMDQTHQIQAQLLQVRWNHHLYAMNITPVPPLKPAAASLSSQTCALNGDAVHLKAPPAVMTITAAAPMTFPSVTSVLEPAWRYMASFSIALKLVENFWRLNLYFVVQGKNDVFGVKAMRRTTAAAKPSWAFGDVAVGKSSA